MVRKNVNSVEDPAVAWATRLWARLEENLLNTQETIIAIIDARAWEPLGYESFAKAWVDKVMSKVTIASELRPHVVYQMFSEGLTPDQVADAVKGISPESAKRLQEQRNHGVPPDQATTIVHEHRRRAPGDWGFVHLKVNTETLRDWHHIAKANDSTVKEIALEAATIAFDALA